MTLPQGIDATTTVQSGLAPDSLGNTLERINFFIRHINTYIIYKQKLFLIKSNNKLFKPLIEIFLLVFGIFIIWMFSLSLIAGMFLIFNTTFGKQKTIYVKSIVKNTDITKSKNGTIHYSITVNIPEINRKVKLKVKREYEINEVYSDTLKVGSLNMIYKFK